MNHPYKLTLAFSSMGNRLLSLLPLIDKLKNCAQVEILVIVQEGTEQHKKSVENFSGIKFIWSGTIGLSRSRNLALETARGDYVWMLDDDVDIPIDHISLLLSEIDQHSLEADIIRVRVGCTENPQELYKRYSKITDIRKLHLLKMNSIELIVRRDFVQQSGVRFNQNIGLGTAFPGNEEAHFLIDAMDMGAKFLIIDRVYVYHSCCEGGRRKAESNAIMEIRGATASRFSWLGIPLIVYWGSRYLLKEKRISVVFSLLKGYCRGYKGYK